MKTDRDLLSEAVDMIEESSLLLTDAIKRPGQFGANLLGVTARVLHRVLRIQILLLRDQVDVRRRIDRLEVDTRFDRLIGGQDE